MINWSLAEKWTESWKQCGVCSLFQLSFHGHSMCQGCLKGKESSRNWVSRLHDLWRKKSWDMFFGILLEWQYILTCSKRICMLTKWGTVYSWRHIYRVIRKSVRDFRPLQYSSRDGHAEGEHVNIGRGTPSFCPTLQVLDMSTLGDAADINPVIKFLPHTLHCVAGNWFQDLHLPRRQGWTYRAPVM